MPATRQMTMRCVDSCVVYAISWSRFHYLLRQLLEFAEAVPRAPALRLRWVSRSAVMLETQSGWERIFAVLLVLADRLGRFAEQGTLIDPQLTHEDLVAISGLSRQFVNATPSDLRKRGFLRTRRQSIVLLDGEALAQSTSVDEHDG